jgi:hypothetical protein
MDGEEPRLGRVLISHIFSVISDIAGVVFSLRAGYPQLYRLFIRVPLVNTPFVSIDFTQKWPWFRIDFNIDTFTVALFVVVIACIICACSSVIHLLVTLWGYHPSVKRKYRRLQLISFVTVIIGWIVEFLDFASSIGPGSYD